MSVPLFVVDAFAAAPFGGNPAAVVLAADARPDAWLAAVAAEMNLSETAFPRPRPDGGWDLRWFTPTVEVDLCGHATLATAHVLWETGRARPDEPLRFQTRSGVLAAVRRADGWIELDLPSDPVRPIEAPRGLEEALAARPLFVGSGAANLLVEVESAAAVRSLRPDQGWLTTAIPDGLIVTARADASGRVDASGADAQGAAIVSRYYCPVAGIPEDPVTGSAHCALGPYWAPRLGPAFRAFQASARGGLVDVAVRGDRVAVAGAAVTVIAGELRV